MRRNKNIESNPKTGELMEKKVKEETNPPTSNMKLSTVDFFGRKVESSGPFITKNLN